MKLTKLFERGEYHVKKFIVLFFICVLAMPWCVSLAETTPEAAADETAVEITFRGLPLGSSISDVREALISEGENESNISVSDYENYGYHLWIYPQSSALALTIGGYEIEFIDLDFYYAISDGTVLTSQEDAGLADAVYNVKASDHLLASKILTKKITSLYGEPTVSEALLKTSSRYINVPSVYYVRTTWQGNGGAAIYLDRCFDSYNGVDIKSEDDLIVEYRLCDTDALMKEIKELEDNAALQKADDEIESGTSDLSGI